MSNRTAATSRRISRYVVVIAMLSVVLAGCGSSSAGEERDGTTAPSKLPKGMGSTAADGEFPRTVTHFGGKSEIPREPKRVAILATGQLDATLSLRSVPVAAARADDAGLVPEYLKEAFPADSGALAKLVDLGTRDEPDLERLADAKPDLILANEQGFKDLQGRLEQIAPTILTEGEGVNWAQDLLIVAAALGKSEQAQELIDKVDAEARKVGRSAGEDTFSIVRIQEDRNRVFGVGSFAGSLTERAGIKRPASQQFSKTSEDVSLENSDVIAGDWIFFATPDGKPGDAPPEALSKGVDTPADRMISINEDTWFLNAGPTAALTVLDDIAAAIE